MAPLIFGGTARPVGAARSSKSGSRLSSEPLSALRANAAVFSLQAAHCGMECLPASAAARVRSAHGEAVHAERQQRLKDFQRQCQRRVSQRLSGQRSGAHAVSPAKAMSPPRYAVEQVDTGKGTSPTHTSHKPSEPLLQPIDHTVVPLHHPVAADADACINRLSSLIAGAIESRSKAMCQLGLRPCASVDVPPAASTNESEQALLPEESTADLQRRKQSVLRQMLKGNHAKLLSGPKEHTVEIRSSQVVVTAEDGIDVLKIVEAKPFLEWVKTISRERRIRVTKLHVQSLDMFDDQVVSIKFKADATVEGKQVPGIVFLRGGAVAVLVILHCNGRRFALLVRQPRVPVCIASLAEIPAGTLDDNGSFAGVAAKEMREQIGIEMNEGDLIDMTKLAYKDQFPGLYSSCGGTDEFNSIYLHQKIVTADELDSLNEKIAGLTEEGDTIKFQVVPLEDLWRKSPDAKTLTALCLYEKLRCAGRVPDFPQDSQASVPSSSSTSVPISQRSAREDTTQCKKKIGKASTSSAALAEALSPGVEAASSSTRSSKAPSARSSAASASASRSAALAKDVSSARSSSSPGSLSNGGERAMRYTSGLLSLLLRAYAKQSRPPPALCACVPQPTEQPPPQIQSDGHLSQAPAWEAYVQRVACSSSHARNCEFSQNLSRLQRQVLILIQEAKDPSRAVQMNLASSSGSLSRTPVSPSCSMDSFSSISKSQCSVPVDVAGTESPPQSAGAAKPQGIVQQVMKGTGKLLAAAESSSVEGSHDTNFRINK